MDVPLMARGPDMLELSLRRNIDAITRTLELQDELERVLQELHDAQNQVEQHGGVPAGVRLRPVMNAAWQRQRGDAFWDRDPTEPTPAP